MQLMQDGADQFIEELEEAGVVEQAHRALSYYDEMSPEEAADYKVHFNRKMDELLEQAKACGDELPENLARVTRGLIGLAINRRAAGRRASPWTDLYDAS